MLHAQFLAGWMHALYDVAAKAKIGRLDKSLWFLIDRTVVRA
jgi:hypothetical protein